MHIHYQKVTYLAKPASIHVPHPLWVCHATRPPLLTPPCPIRQTPASRQMCMSVPPKWRATYMGLRRGRRSDRLVEAVQIVPLVCVCVCVCLCVCMC